VRNAHAHPYPSSYADPGRHSDADAQPAAYTDAHAGAKPRSHAHADTLSAPDPDTHPDASRHPGPVDHQQDGHG
jgi:hypothetical protein